MTRTLPWQKPNHAKNYYPVPKVICQLGLSPGEIAVYSFLLFCEDRKTYQCYPSYRTIGDAVGMSRNTVCKYVRSLEEKGLMQKQACGIVGGFMEDIFGKELKPWQENEKPETEQ